MGGVFDVSTRRERDALRYSLLVVIGYYIHHHGSGHLHRATVLAAALDEPVTGLSSLPQPTAWAGQWLTLPLDTDTSPALDATANGRLHWVPRGSAGLAERMAAIAAWIATERPSAVVVDVSVEVALLCRLLGIPVVVIAQPGIRTDPAHTLAYEVAAAVIAPWPDGVDPLTTSVDLGRVLHHVGAISRLPVGPRNTARRTGPIVVLTGTGTRGPGALDSVVAHLRAGARHDLEIAQGSPDEIAALLQRASVVVAHCGQNAIAEIAAARVPAVLVPEHRPHDEQAEMAKALAASVFPVVVLGDVGDEPAAAVARAQSLDGERWAEWVDGRAAQRAAEVIARIAGAHR